MEQFLRKLLEKVGAGADDLLGKEASRLSPEALIPALYQAVESNLAEDQQGTHRVAPGRITIVLSYEVHSRVEADDLEAVGQELTETVVSYIHDHRYVLQPGLKLEIICDPFLRQPFEIRVSRDRSPAQVKRLWLEALDGRRVALNLGEPGTANRLTLGRAGDNDIVVDDPTVSRFHASITLNQQGEVFVSDLGSANGTFINGERIRSSHVLRENDELILGSVPFVLKRG